MTYSLKLFFAENDTAAGQIPGVLAYVAIKTAVEDSINGETAISHECVGPTELTAEVTRLKAELDTILADGMRRFKRHRSNVRGTSD